MEQPQSIVELRSGEFKMILCCESPEEVKEIVNGCEERLATIHRFSITEGAIEFTTRPDNVITVRPNV